MIIRTGYSVRTAWGHLKDVFDRLEVFDIKTVAIADRCSTFSFNRATKLAKAAGIRLVYGVELAVVPELGLKQPPIDYWRFLAIDDLRPLHDLIYQATDNPGREPSLTIGQALTAPGLISVAGERCLIDSLPNRLPAEFHLGLFPSTSKGLLNRAVARGLPLLASCDNYYPRPTDKEIYRVALGRRASTQTYPMWIMNDEELGASLSQKGVSPLMISAALQARDTALGRCQAVMRKGTLLVPEKPKTLRAMCEERAPSLGVPLSDPLYAARLTRELDLIAQKEFEDYFYIISDMVRWAKKRMIVGPARGSSCGSLVCHLLDITTIDPLKYDLLFERFIDASRADLPDIDIDFSDVNRHLVFEYCEKKYGKERVARLGTMGMFAARSALKQAGTSLRIPAWRTDKLADSIIFRSSGDARAMNTLEDTLKQTEAGKALLDEHPALSLVTGIEGHPAIASQHAAGVLLTNTPVRDYVAVDARTGAAWLDKKDAEDLNLLKVDALGLVQLSIFERTLELIGQKPVNGFLEKIPLDDKMAFEVMNKGHYSGVFQFMGLAVRSLAVQIKFDHIEDFIALTALARPGPLSSGGSSAWIRRKTGQEVVPKAIHPLLEEYTKNTFGVVVYQETTMFIVRNIGNFSWEDTTKIRKVMSNRQGDEAFAAFAVQFRKGATKNGLTEKQAADIWDNINKFGSWAFNRCLCGTTRIKLSKAGSHSPKTLAALYQAYEEKPSRWIRQRKSRPWFTSLFDDGRGRPQEAIKIMKSGLKACYRYLFDDGSEVICTPEHRFLVDGDWCQISEAEIGAKFTSLEYDDNQEANRNGRGKGHSKGRKYQVAQEGFAAGEENIAWTNGASAFADEFKATHKGAVCQDCGTALPRMEAHHNDFNDGKDRPTDLVWLCSGCHKRRHYDEGRRKVWEKGLRQSTKTLVSVERFGMRETYDVAMPTQHNFSLENGLVTHNSHAVAYGTVSYYCAYLKAHYPIEFAAATLDAQPDPAKQLALLRELDAEGVKYAPVDAELSTERWAPALRGNQAFLVGPLTSIKGIGAAKVREILDARANGTELKPGLKRLIEEATTELDDLYPIAAEINRLHPDLAALNIVTKPTPIIEVQKGFQGDAVVMGRVKKIAPRNENEAVNIEKRGGRRVYGPEQALNLWLEDDSDELYVKIDRYNYERLGRKIVEEGKAGRTLLAIKGRVPANFRMLTATAVKWLKE